KRKRRDLRRSRSTARSSTTPSRTRPSACSRRRRRSPRAVEPTGRMFTWLKEGTPEARRALLAASLGWGLDAFDVMLAALVIATLIRELSLSTAQAGLLGSVTLVASGIGGVMFGLIADRIGRRPAMLASILVYSVFTAACGLAQNVWQLALFRF